MSSSLRALMRTLRWHKQQKKMSPNDVVFITGCDSGLGFSFAVFCHSLNMTVISACHNINSEGANILRSLSDPKRMITIELDLLKQDTIVSAQMCLTEVLQQNQDYKLTALVNNAGVMCFGEFEWQTMMQIEKQINVNLLGTMRITKQLLPLLRQQCGRIINITSHCGLQALPTLSSYAASKGALRFWNDALRIEMKQYNVDVINFIPGSFITESNISSRQKSLSKEMWSSFDEEQRLFYGNYFQGLNDYLNQFTGPKPPNRVQDQILLEKFKDAMTNKHPKSLYIHEPWRYKLYRFLFRVCPTSVVDWLAVRFCAMPTYQQFPGPYRPIARN